MLHEGEKQLAVYLPKPLMRRLRFEAVCRELSVKALLEAILDEKLPKLAEQTRRSRQKL